VISTTSVLERHVDWVTQRRAALRPWLYGRRLQPYAHDRGFLALPPGAELPAEGRVEGEFMHLDQLRWLPNDILAKADRATMRASLEFRTPFLHRELAELAASIPARTHVGGGGKRVLRQVLNEVLPDGRHARGKIAFRAPTAEWLRGPLAPVLREQLESSALYRDGWIDRQAVRRTLAEHGQGRDWTRVLWPVLVLGSWLDHFGERRAR